MESYDAIIVGGGPAGSSCARVLASRGMRVAVLDRARFPRVKLCAGWVSAPIWKVLDLSPSSYPYGLWEWNRCHVHFRGRLHTVRAHGFFIRRYEFDDYLLRTSGAEVHERSPVKTIERTQDGGFEVDGAFCAPYLVGAGGTHCPVARALFPAKPLRPVGVQEREFESEPRGIAASRLGGDGEPELLLHDDLRGYSWNVPKTTWLNVGCGTVNARDVKDAWGRAREFLVQRGHVPEEAAPALERMQGHSYYLFHPDHLDACEASGAFLVGDALGLAHPLTAEGILPAVLSGKLAAESILADDPAAYRRRLASHPILSHYRHIFRLRAAGASLRKRSQESDSPAQAQPPARLASWAVAKTFAWMFSGKAPGARLRLRHRS